MDLVVVDGPNLYNSSTRLLATDGQKTTDDALQLYFTEWFDMDRLVRATLGPHEDDPTLGIVILHSRRALGGRAPYRLSKSDPFWARQGGSPNTSCITVDIPGDQQEKYPFECKKCHTANEIETTTEKGIDTATTTYLLETADRWESVCIFSRDVDFVPPVLALRRKGKRVFVAGEHDDRQTALGRACQSFYELSSKFLLDDFALMRFVNSGGPLDQVAMALTSRDFKISLPINFDAGNKVSIGIRHEEGDRDAPGTKSLVTATLAAAGAAPSLIWTAPTDQVVEAGFDVDQFVGEGSSRHASRLLMNTHWYARLGPIHTLWSR